MHADTGWDANLAEQIIAEHAAKPGALLPTLHALTKNFGYIPKPCIQMLATALNLSRAEVHGVITFYHDFRTEPPARHVLKICRAESCQSMGGEALVAHAEHRLGITIGAQTADDQIALEAVYCLGLCATSPAVMLNEQLFARLTATKLDALLSATNA